MQQLKCKLRQQEVEASQAAASGAAAAQGKAALQKQLTPEQQQQATPQQTGDSLAVEGSQEQQSPPELTLPLHVRSCVPLLYQQSEAGHKAWCHTRSCIDCACVPLQFVNALNGVSAFWACGSTLSRLMSKHCIPYGLNRQQCIQCEGHTVSAIQ